MKLSKNLTLAEVTKSATAKRRGISNDPTIDHMENLKAVAENIFQPMRDYFKVPIMISSGYRSKELNDAIGGSLASQHSKGEALDIDCPSYSGLSNREVFEYIKEHLTFDQLIWEFGNESDPAWVHVSYKRSGRNRGEILRAKRNKGKTYYEFY